MQHAIIYIYKEDINTTVIDEVGDQELIEDYKKSEARNLINKLL